ncbi:MAG: shikimate dehydrogenase [Bacteroidota bacterium]
MLRFGLIGFPLSHSFSRKYFTEKFSRMGLGHTYHNFEMENIQDFPDLFTENLDLKGLNVTIPHKKAVMDFLDEVTPRAKRIGAVNTILIREDGKKIGYNTDYIGFRDSLLAMIGERRDLKALILGTGGAAEAARVVIEDLNISIAFTSRTGGRDLHEHPVLDYEGASVNDFPLIINTTPLGMYPKVENAPPLDYENLTKDHFLFDLVYNPEETRFLRYGSDVGATTQNGLPMLHGQAEAAWEIWTK